MTRKPEPNGHQGLGCHSGGGMQVQCVQSLGLTLHKPGMVMHISNLSTQDTEAGESQVQCHLWLLSSRRVWDL